MSPIVQSSSQSSEYKYLSSSSLAAPVYNNAGGRKERSTKTSPVYPHMPCEVYT